MIRTDGDVVCIAQQIDHHLQRVRELVAALEESAHPNAGSLVYDLNDNLIPPLAWATHVVSHSLLHPERWETGDFGIRYKTPTPIYPPTS